MGIELVFFCILLIFVVTGLLHGYRRELGVTIVLMLVLSLLQLSEGHFGTQFTQVLNLAISSNAIYRETMRGLVYSILLLLAVFFAYQGDVFRFPGRDTAIVAPVLSGASGLLNGYLLAGSLWYYLGQAGWPYLNVMGPFSATYWTAWRLLPPQILAWPILFVFAIGMLVIRLWK